MKLYPPLTKGLITFYHYNYFVCMKKIASTTGADPIHNYSIHLSTNTSTTRCPGIDYTLTVNAVRCSWIELMYYTIWGKSEHVVCCSNEVYKIRNAIYTILSYYNYHNYSSRFNVTHVQEGHVETYNVGVSDIHLTIH